MCRGVEAAMNCAVIVAEVKREAEPRISPNQT